MQRITAGEKGVFGFSRLGPGAFTTARLGATIGPRAQVTLGAHPGPFRGSQGAIRWALGPGSQGAPTQAQRITAGEKVYLALAG